eukprot:163058-Amphidinium_carterae.2
MVRKDKTTDYYYEKMLMQEMIQQSYIKYHPTSGYKTATPEMKRVYDGFEVFNYHKERNPRGATTTNAKDEDWKHMGLTQLLGISLHYAPTFFNTMKIQQLDNLRQQGWEEEQLGKLPASYMENSTDERHTYYNFHSEVQYAINDYINLNLYNYPDNYNQTAVQFAGQSYYFTVVHTTDRLIEQLQADMKDTNRQTTWYTRKDMDRQFQIKRERIGREGSWKTINCHWKVHGDQDYVEEHHRG